MRGNAEAHEMIAPGSLAAVLEILAAEPGQWTPIAGGTELMVAHAAGRLSANRLISLWGIPDLRFIETAANSIVIGAGATFRDLRLHPAIAKEFPLLARAASWIGSIANQSRATIGGNLVNGSPAADSSPALLVYDAEVELVSCEANGAFRTPNSTPATSVTLLAADELLFAIHLAATIWPASPVSAQGGNAARHGHCKGRAGRYGAARRWRDQRDSAGRGEPCAVSRTALSN